MMRIPCCFILSSLLLLWAAVAGATDVLYDGQTAGSVLTPWAGTISGTIQVVDAHPEGETLVWVRDLNLTATPPIPNETWWPVAGRATVGWQLFQIILDWILGCASPEQPSALDRLTGNNYEALCMANNAEFGIQAVCQGTNHGGSEPNSSGSCAVSADRPFHYCLNQYTATALMSPVEPGVARLVGHATLPQEYGTELVLDIDVRYTFDPSLNLDGYYLVHREGAYSIVEGEVQSLVGTDTYSETRVNPALVRDSDVETAMNLTTFPNPSRAQVWIDLLLDRRSDGSITIFDPGGRLVRKIVAGPFRAGLERFRWDGRDEAGRPVVSGVYYARLQSNGGTAIRKIMISR